MGEERHRTPAHHLEELLARAQNPFDVSDRVLHRLRSAVMFRVELRGWRHHNTPLPTLRCSSFRHIFLLADGSSLLLWELCYDAEDTGDRTGEGVAGPASGACQEGPATELCEVYDCEEALRLSERRVHQWMGGGPDPTDPAEGAEGCPVDPADAGDGAGRREESGDQEAWEGEPGGFADESEPFPWDGPLFDGRPLGGVPLPGLPLGAPELDGLPGGLPGELPDEGPPFDDRRFDDPVFGSVTAGDLGTEDGGLELGPGPDETDPGPGLDPGLGLALGPDPEPGLGHGLGLGLGLGNDHDPDHDPLAEGRGGPARLSFDFLLRATGPGTERREYAERGSPDHARRLLRRAENEDRPGEETLRLLDQALGHQILHVPGPLARAGECHVWCSVYEHAFLLPDGSEVSLYELEHNLSGNGHLVCEVYLEESIAGQAAHRLARDRGIDL